MSESEEPVLEFAAAETELSQFTGFHGVYLLVSKNLVCGGRTYVGYTVNPTRRITQHNRGALYGGARRTSDKGPWEMILIVHGFPTSTAALKFEWAWQHPHHSKHLKKMFKSSHKRGLSYCINIMWTMLSIPPWKRLPLVIRWLAEKHFDPIKMMKCEGCDMRCKEEELQDRWCYINQKRPNNQREVLLCRICGIKNLSLSEADISKLKRRPTEEGPFDLSLLFR